MCLQRRGCKAHYQFSIAFASFYSICTERHACELKLCTNGHAWGPKPHLFKRKTWKERRKGGEKR